MVLSLSSPGQVEKAVCLIRPAWTRPICKVMILLSASGPAVLLVASLCCAVVAAHGWALGNHASQKMQCILKAVILARLTQAALGAQTASLCSAVELCQAAWKAFHSLLLQNKMLSSSELLTCWVRFAIKLPGDAQQGQFGVARGQLTQWFQDSLFPAIWRNFAPVCL